MSKTFMCWLLAGTVLPGFALAAAPALAAPDGVMKFAQAPADADKDKKPPPKAAPPTPPKPPAAAPPPPPKPPVAQPVQPPRTQQPAAAPTPPPPKPQQPAAAPPALKQQQPAAQAPAGPPGPPRRGEERRDERREQRQQPAQQQQQQQQQLTPQQPVQTQPRAPVAPLQQQQTQQPVPRGTVQPQIQQTQPQLRQQTQPLTTQPPVGLVTGPSNVKKLDDLRGQRRESREGNATVIQERDRTITREGGRLTIRHDDTERFRHNARNVSTERRGNDNAIIVERPNGTRIITVNDANGRLVRRIRRDRDGREVVIIDNSRRGPGGIAALFLNLRPPVVRIPRDRYIVEADRAPVALLYETLIAGPVEPIERAYSLDEVRYNYELLERMPRVDIDTVTFETGSWEIGPEQARRLESIAAALLRAIERNPNEVFLIEGHTDAVGNDIDNLSLSDRRAESVATVLTEQFNVPPENLTTQGYGEQHLKVPTNGPERLNRRVTVRRIGPLLGELSARR